MTLPEQPTPTGQPTAQARQIINAIEEVYAPPTSYRDNSRLPTVGTAPPVPQPGRPAMSQRAVDVNTTILTSSVLATALGGATTAILWGSGHANPTVVAWVCGCVVAIPAALTIPVLALKGLMKSAKEVVQAAPTPVHNHYEGDVHIDQRSITSKTTGVIANTRNQHPN